MGWFFDDPPEPVNPKPVRDDPPPYKGSKNYCKRCAQGYETPKPNWCFVCKQKPL